MIQGGKFKKTNTQAVLETTCQGIPSRLTQEINIQTIGITPPLPNVMPSSINSFKEAPKIRPPLASSFFGV